MRKLKQALVFIAFVTTFMILGQSFTYNQIKSKESSSRPNKVIKSSENDRLETHSETIGIEGEDTAQLL